MVLSPGVEPGALVPQTSILSIKLREHLTAISVGSIYTTSYLRGQDNNTIMQFRQFRNQIIQAPSVQMVHAALLQVIVPLINLQCYPPD